MSTIAIAILKLSVPLNQSINGFQILHCVQNYSIKACKTQNLKVSLTPMMMMTIILTIMIISFIISVHLNLLLSQHI